MNDNRKGLLLLLSHWDILGKLPPDEFKTVLQAVFASAGANCDMPGEMSLLEQIAYESINKDVQWSFDQYEKTRAKRAEAGRKGGLKKAENAKKHSESESDNNETPSSESLANASKDLANSSKTSNATFATSKSKQNIANEVMLDPLKKAAKEMVETLENRTDEPDYIRIGREWDALHKGGDRPEDTLGPMQWPIYQAGN